MNPRELNILTKRAGKLRRLIKSQHSIPKEERNQTAIDEAIDRLQRIQGWIKPRKEKAPVQPMEVMSKKEFMAMLARAEAGSEMTINTIAELKKAWSTIRGKNINIKAPKHVMLKAKELAKKDIRK